jgi:AraC-like DNA-binding protein
MVDGISGSPLHLGDIRAAIRFIEENLASYITLEDIARAGNMSKSHLNEWFRAVTGMTPYEYLLVSRVERAVELLRSTDMTVLDISETCGFSNLANFNKAFKKRTGLTPQAYRKIH